MQPGEPKLPGELGRAPGENLALGLGDDVTHIPAEPRVTRMLGPPGTDVPGEFAQRGAQRRHRVGRQARHHRPAGVAPQVRLEARGRLAAVLGHGHMLLGPPWWCRTRWLTSAGPASAVTDVTGPSAAHSSAITCGASTTARPCPVAKGY